MTLSATWFQEVLINLWKSLPSFKGRSDVRSWIYRVSLNVCISLDHKKRRHKTVPLTMDINPYEETETNQNSRQMDMLRQRIARLGHYDRAIFNFWNVSTIRNKHLAVDDVLSAQQRLITFKRREKLYTYGIFPFIFLWVVWLLFDVYYGTDIPFPSSDRLLVDLVLIVIVLVLLFYVFSREMRSLNKAIKDIDEFTGKE